MNFGCPSSDFVEEAEFRVEIDHEVGAIDDSCHASGVAEGQGSRAGCAATEGAVDGQICAGERGADKGGAAMDSDVAQRPYGFGSLAVDVEVVQFDPAVAVRAVGGGDVWRYGDRPCASEALDVAAIDVVFQPPSAD